VTLAIISMELWVFRWVINRMPVFGEAHEVVVEEETVEDMEVVTWKAPDL